MTRRKLGQLEAEVLAVLAGADAFLSTGERLDGAPAHTTINTILFRLLGSGAGAASPTASPPTSPGWRPSACSATSAWPTIRRMS
ncbi:hypothetical protein [Nonomuraea jabiensis]|uniref:hypothetical protein n=1 Tax=Nonomuraea jabiensis TaxID=882448 RepID=UPI003D709DD1